MAHTEMHGIDDTHDVYPPHRSSDSDNDEGDDDDEYDDNDDDGVDYKDEDSNYGESSVASYTIFPYHHFQFPPDVMHLLAGIFLSSLSVLL